MRALSGLLSGFVFGLGLLISGMSNPIKVQNFLDIAGAWDPSLAFVMGGAIIVTMPLFWLLRRRESPLFADVFHWPTQSDLPPRLFIGSALFGIGWGLGGYCPGPAMAGLPALGSGSVIFVAAMLAGMLLAKIVTNALDEAQVARRQKALAT